MPPKQQNHQDAAEEEQRHEEVQPQNEMNWTGASLKSVPVNIIQYCLWKSQEQSQNSKKISTSVRIHLAKGHYRYRAEKLCSIDDAMNVRLENIIVSKVKRDYLNSLEGKNHNNNQNNIMTVTQLLPAGAAHQGSRVVLSGGAATASSSSIANNQIPWNEQAVEVKKSILLPGSNIVMIELPNEWTELFDAQARAVRSEFYRRVRENKKIRKEAKKQVRKELEEKRKEKKAKKAEKAALLKAGAKKSKGKKK